jgi:hypothetical protein
VVGRGTAVLLSEAKNPHYCFMRISSLKIIHIVRYEKIMTKSSKSELTQIRDLNLMLMISFEWVRFIKKDALTRKSIDPLWQVGGVHGGVLVLLHPLVVVVVAVVVASGQLWRLIATPLLPGIFCKKMVL